MQERQHQELNQTINLMTQSIPDEMADLVLNCLEQTERYSIDEERLDDDREKVKQGIAMAIRNLCRSYAIRKASFDSSSIIHYDGKYPTLNLHFLARAQDTIKVLGVNQDRFGNLLCNCMFKWAENETIAQDLGIQIGEEEVDNNPEPIAGGGRPVGRRGKGFPKIVRRVVHSVPIQPKRRPLIPSPAVA